MKIKKLWVLLLSAYLGLGTLVALGGTSHDYLPDKARDIAEHRLRLILIVSTVCL